VWFEFKSSKCNTCVIDSFPFPAYKISGFNTFITCWIYYTWSQCACFSSAYTCMNVITVLDFTKLKSNGSDPLWTCSWPLKTHVLSWLSHTPFVDNWPDFVYAQLFNLRRKTTKDKLSSANKPFKHVHVEKGEPCTKRHDKYTWI